MKRPAFQFYPGDWMRAGWLSVAAAPGLSRW